MYKKICFKFYFLCLNVIIIVLRRPWENAFLASSALPNSHAAYHKRSALILALGDFWDLLNSLNWHFAHTPAHLDGLEMPSFPREGYHYCWLISAWVKLPTSLSTLLGTWCAPPLDWVFCSRLRASLLSPPLTPSLNNFLPSHNLWLPQFHS